MIRVDPSYISRIERGEREPPRRIVVLDLADALALDPFERFAFLVSAGHAPDGLSTGDVGMVQVGLALVHPHLTDLERIEFRAIIVTLAEHWFRLGEERAARELSVPGVSQPEPAEGREPAG